MSKARLRSMTYEDLLMVLSWRNHPEVRHFMYTNHEISFDEHCSWFERAEHDTKTYLKIYENGGEAFGFINIGLLRSLQIADWGFYLAPHAPRGSGHILGNEVLKFAFGELQLHKLCGQVLGFNERSIAFHKRLGFLEEGRLRDQHFDGVNYHDVVCFGLLANEWQLTEAN